MDYSGYTDFPFPADLPDKDRKLKDYFLSLPDDEQIYMLSGCEDYRQFHNRIYQQYDYTHTI